MIQLWRGVKGIVCHELTILKDQTKDEAKVVTK
jgi:hypothetical protein